MDPATEKQLHSAITELVKTIQLEIKDISAASHKDTNGQRDPGPPIEAALPPNCAGTAGTYGTLGGCLGTFGSYGSLGIVEGNQPNE